MAYNERTFKTLTENINTMRANGSLKNTVAYLQEKAKPYLAKSLVDAKGSEKKLLVQAANLITAFVDGASSNDVGLKDVRGLVNDLGLVVKAHDERSFRKAQKEENEQKSSTLRNEGDYPEYQPDNNSYDIAPATNSVYAKYHHFASELHFKSKAPFFAKRMPVVALLTGIPVPGKMHKTGLSDDDLFGYPIIKNQLLVGYTLEHLAPNIANWSKYQKQIKNNVPITTALDINWEDVNLEMHQSLKERFGRSFINIGRVCHKFSGNDRLWVWMIDEKELRLLNPAASGGRFTVNNWTLPFASEMKQLDRKY